MTRALSQSGHLLMLGGALSNGTLSESLQAVNLTSLEVNAVVSITESFQGRKHHSVHMEAVR